MISEIRTTRSQLQSVPPALVVLHRQCLPKWDQTMPTSGVRFANTPHAESIDTARRHFAGTANHSIGRTLPSSVAFHSEEEDVACLFNRHIIGAIYVPFVAIMLVRRTGMGQTEPAGTAMGLLGIVALSQMLTSSAMHRRSRVNEMSASPRTRRRLSNLALKQATWTCLMVGKVLVFLSLPGV